MGKGGKLKSYKPKVNRHIRKQQRKTAISPRDRESRTSVIRDTGYIPDLKNAGKPSDIVTALIKEIYLTRGMKNILKRELQGESPNNPLQLADNALTNLFNPLYLNCIKPKVDDFFSAIRVWIKRHDNSKNAMVKAYCDIVKNSLEKNRAYCRYEDNIDTKFNSQYHFDMVNLDIASKLAEALKDDDNMAEALRDEEKPVDIINKTYPRQTNFFKNVKKMSKVIQHLGQLLKPQRIVDNHPTNVEFVEAILGWCSDNKSATDPVTKAISHAIVSAFETLLQLDFDINVAVGDAKVKQKAHRVYDEAVLNKLDIVRSEAEDAKKPFKF